MENLICEIKSIIFRDEATGFVVLGLKDPEGNFLRAAGNLPRSPEYALRASQINAGAFLRLTGIYVDDPKYGREFAFSGLEAVASVKPDVPIAPAAPSEPDNSFSTGAEQPSRTQAAGAPRFAGAPGAYEVRSFAGEPKVCGWLDRDIIERVAASKFRSSFKLKKADREYIREKGLDAIRTHAGGFISKRLAPAFPANDGKQTPMRGAPKGHPVFIAQHATGTCCRGCLQKWHGIPQGREMTAAEQERAVDVIMRWLENELE